MKTNNETKGETITMEPKTDEDNIRKNRHFNVETETNPTHTQSTDIADNRLPSRQRKAPKILSKDFLW